MLLIVFFYSFVGRSIQGGRMAFTRLGVVALPSLSPPSPITCEDPLHQIPYLIRQYAQYFNNPTQESHATLYVHGHAQIS